MRAAVAAILLLATCSSSCASHYGVPGPAHPRTARDHDDPVGRWLAVMTLRCGVPVRVVTRSGGIHTGRVTASSHDYLVVDQNGAAVRMERGDILRVDLPPDARSRIRSIVGQTAAMALALAGYEVFLGLLFAGDLHVPPARTWAIGAAAGAGLGAAGAVLARSRTIYVSPEAACGAIGTTCRR